MAKINARPGDLTGRTKAALQEQHAAEVEARAEQIALVTAEAAAKAQEPVDLVPNKPEVKEEVVGEVAVATDVSVSEEIVQFRTNETFSCTLGHGNNYDFVEGQPVRAPRWIYTHLDEKGLVWH